MKYTMQRTGENAAEMKTENGCCIRIIFDKRELTSKKEGLQRQLKELSMEVGKSLCGESTFPVEVLSMSINSTKEDLSETDKLLESCDAELEKQADVLSKLDFYYGQFVSWADEFEEASLEQKKMIICQLIREIRVLVVLSRVNEIFFENLFS